MTYKEANNIIKAKTGFNDEDMKEYKNIYKNIVKDQSGQDFYWSMINWFFAGDAPYYENYLKRMWIK